MMHRYPRRAAAVEGWDTTQEDPVLRLAAFLTCPLLVAVAAVAAPAPVYKPDRTRWLGVAGWDRPACEGASCTRHGDRIAVSMPPPAPGRVRSFSLGRDAEGDFVLAIRLKVNLKQRGDKGHYWAGIAVSGGEASVSLDLSGRRGDGDDGFASLHFSQAGSLSGRVHSGFSMSSPLTLRLSRQAGKVLAEYSRDGKGWVRLKEGWTGIELPKKVQLSVVAGASASDAGTFEAVFDKFSADAPEVGWGLRPKNATRGATMRKSLFACLAVVLVLAGGLFALLGPLHCPVNRAAFGRIKEGMTPAEVQATLGGPPGDYRTRPRPRPLLRPFPNWVFEAPVEEWEGDDGVRPGGLHHLRRGGREGGVHVVHGGEPPRWAARTGPLAAGEAVGVAPLSGVLPQYPSSAGAYPDLRTSHRSNEKPADRPRTATRLYPYVGPPAIKGGVAGSPAGTRAGSADDILNWAKSTGERSRPDDLVAATFVVSPAGDLLLAARRSEHVACAGGGPVLAAGEMFFRVEGGAVEVAEVSNQSTGYCPEPGSWAAVAVALEKAGVTHPGKFTTEVVFRRCTECGERNVVKDGWYICGVCGAKLPLEWNF